MCDIVNRFDCRCDIEQFKKMDGKNPETSLLGLVEIAEKSSLPQY